jgi:outer membrane immunogenic protein
MIAAFAALAGMSTTSYAADIYGGSMKDAPVEYAAPAASWTGFYIGVGVGGGASVTDLSVNVEEYRYLEAKSFDGDYDSNSFELFGLDGIGGEGVFGTVQVGYDRQLSSHFVLGAFVDYDFSDISTEIRASNGRESFSTDLDLDHMWSVGVRAGFLTSPDTMVYALVAYTQGEYSADDFDFDLDVDGWSVGAGIETRLSDNLTLKGEYRFTQFDEENVLEFGPLSVDVEPSVHTARVVLSYRINPFHDAMK